jgi:SPP1 family predicted phage head-tail adaptor
VNIGKLNTRARIERKSVTQDATYGTETVTWALLATVWCEKQDVLPSKSEAVKNGIAVALNQSRIRLRYRSDLDSTMRLVIGGVAHQIIAGPAVIGNKDGIELMVEKASS